MTETPKHGTGKAGNVSRSPQTSPGATAGAGAGQPPASGGEPSSGPTGRSRRGAPKGNRNAIRHGLACGQCPPGAEFVENRVNRFRRELEDAVLASKGEVSLIDAASIQTAAKWERHGALALRWLNKEGGNLKPLERLQFSREIARASTERDKAVAALGLGQKEERPWLIVPSADDAAADLEDK